MLFRRLIASCVLVLACTVCMTLSAGAARAGAPSALDVAHLPRSATTLAEAVERRAEATSYAALEAFGEAALTRDDRRGLSHLDHVVWLLVNQGDFARAAHWNSRLAEKARRQGDARYSGIARSNALGILSKLGRPDARAEIKRLAASDEGDWFVHVRVASMAAVMLVEENRTGEGLKLLTETEAHVPLGDPYARIALARLWEAVSMGSMSLIDIDGATAAFQRFEIDYAEPGYPRPDFDSLYNMTILSLQVGNQAGAERYFAANRRLTQRTDSAGLFAYDAYLCALVADGREKPDEVLSCLAPLGEDLGAARFMAGLVLPNRVIARARTGQLRAAHRDLEEIHRLDAAGTFNEEGVTRIPLAEAEVLFAEGRSDEAFRILEAYNREQTIAAGQRFTKGLGQITDSMQQKLDDRRRQLEAQHFNVRLQQFVIAGGVVFLIFALGAVWWLWRQAERLRLARRRAEDANRSKSEFLANMSHEIRTPLNGVVAMADTLRRRALPPAEQDMVEIIRSSGALLERILSDILDSARIESGQLTIEKTANPLGGLVREMAAIWAGPARSKGVDLVVDLDPALERTVECDGVRLRQVLTNLISNALKFTETGSVRVTVTPVGETRVRFAVIDTGVGFETADKDRIFGRFQQADGSITRRFGGTGLGLAISRELVELMGGALECDSAPGAGSAFWFEIDLPTVQEPAPVEMDAVEAESVAVDGGFRVLLADDHPANRKVVEIMLGPTGADLVAVENGAQAVEAFRRGVFDLVMMDMQMPVMDGLTATAEIRALEAREGRQRTPVMMLTANAMAEHVEAGRRAGADSHLSKPITSDRLFEAIDTLLAAQAPTAAIMTEA